MLFRCAVVSCLLAAVAAPSLASDTFHNALSLQGFTGVLNTPNAETTDEGRFYFLYSNQTESNWRRVARSQDNWMMSLGLYDLIEVGGRFVEAPGKARDLSGSFKVKIPFIPKGKYWPKLAVGMQDISGGSKAQYLKTSYAVASEELWRFRFSAGYGHGPDRMKGAFGGVEAKACDWAYLLADYDTREKNVGVRFITPALFGYPVTLHATVKTSLDHDPNRPEFAVGMQLPLGIPRERKEPIALSGPSTGESLGEAPVPASEPAAPAAPATPAPAQTPPSLHGQGSPQTPPPLQGEGRGGDGAISSPLSTLLKRLTDDGFENVRVGSKGRLLVVEYENTRYNWNELDALGVVSGMAEQEAGAAFDTLRIVEKKKGIAILQVETPLAQLRAFFADASGMDAFSGALKITPDISDEEGVTFISGDSRPSYLRATLELYPQLATYLGTEVGAFDYLLSIRPELFVDTWKGATVNARWDIPVSWSENYEDGKTFRGDRKGTQLQRVMLFQALHPYPTVIATLGGGMILHDSYGTLNEVTWTPGNGNHRFRAIQLFADNDNGSNRKETYLGSYRYYFAPLDTYLEGTVGKFYTQDRGALAEFKRYFGDTAITLYYKNSVATDGRNHQAGGIQFQFPLTPRRDMKRYRYFPQIKGTNEWSYAQETSIAKNGQVNYLGTPIGIKPEPPVNAGRVFYNRDRLSEGYLKKHLLRLRDAYATYLLPAK